METGQWPAEFSFKAVYSQGLSIWCLCFVTLSAFKAVIGSISYMTLNLAIEAIFSWVQWIWECSIFAKTQLVKAVRTKEHPSSFHLPCEILVRLINDKEGWILSQISLLDISNIADIQTNTIRDLFIIFSGSPNAWYVTPLLRDTETSHHFQWGQPQVLCVMDLLQCSHKPC